MTLEEHITKWAGKTVDFDGVYPKQCMDLVHWYVYEVLGISDKTVLAKPWASKVYTEFSWPQYFNRIANSTNNMPVKGDIAIYKEEINYDPAVKHGYGHICVVTEANINNFKSFDANWPVGSLPHIQGHDYNSIWGWLHPITQPQIDWRIKYQEILTYVRQIRDVLRKIET